MSSLTELPAGSQMPASESGAPAAAPKADADARELMIRARGLGKKFKIYSRPWVRLAEWFPGGRVVRHSDFWALRDVSFEVRRGESLGVIGVNGSGKSTLLKILSGAMVLSEGEFQVNGRVLSLLELGTGLNPELTGRQNVLTSSQLLAFPPGYAAQKMPEIEAFAEIGEFFDRPVRLYSSGMLVRLVFGMFACFDPDVFIVDEALSVGDIYFQQKCSNRIRQMLQSGVTMLFVSHDLAAVETLCDRVMVLHGGRSQFIGDKRQGIQLYYSLVGASLPREGGNGAVIAASATAAAPLRADEARTPDSVSSLDPKIVSDLPWQPLDRCDEKGDGRIVVTGLCYRREDGTDSQIVRRGEWVQLWVRLEAKARVGPVNVGIALQDRFNQLLFAVNWVNADIEPAMLQAGQTVVARFSFRADLEPGEYGIWIGASEALPDSSSSTGWNQHLGGADFVALPRGGKLAVLPPADNRRSSFGPANLATALDRVILPSAIQTNG